MERPASLVEESKMVSPEGGAMLVLEEATVLTVYPATGDSLTAGVDTLHVRAGVRVSSQGEEELNKRIVNLWFIYFECIETKCWSKA